MNRKTKIIEDFKSLNEAMSKINKVVLECSFL